MNNQPIQPPYRISWGSSSNVSLAVLHEHVPLHETLRAMDASIVGILALPAPSSEQEEEPHQQPPAPQPAVVEHEGGLRVYGPFSATPGATPPPAPLAPCIGLGILRAVDRKVCARARVCVCLVRQYIGSNPHGRDLYSFIHPL